jgi:hypothetical protein
VSLHTKPKVRTFFSRVFDDRKEKEARRKRRRRWKEKKNERQAETSRPRQRSQGIFARTALLNHKNIMVRLEKEIVRSANDNRDYRYLELENGMRVLLIHDPQAEKAAAALDVNIGA